MSSDALRCVLLTRVVGGMAVPLIVINRELVWSVGRFQSESSWHRSFGPVVH